MLGRDTAVWLIGSLCQVHRIPFASALLIQQFPPPYTQSVLQRALHAYGFTAGTAPWRAGAVALPCVAFFKDTPETPALILHADSERLMYVRAGQVEPQTLAAAEFSAHFGPEIWLVTLDPDTDAARSARGAGKLDDEGNPLAAPAFGFTWFVPELLRHKNIWADVLLASLAIQLVGLTTPLLTQVIIDKVVVNQTMSTLWAVGVGLVAFMLFAAVMTWLRQYLVLHTGNRIDAVLGTAVFRHLLRLPLRYFEHRPTGTLVARLQGVENIRNFVSSAAVTLLLDCPFLVVFLAVMFWYSWQLSLVAVLMLGLICLLSIAVTPLFRTRLDHQFMVGARNQAFVTEYVAGLATVKSLQMEPVLEQKYDNFLAQYLAATFSTRTLANTYNVLANAMEQTMTLAILLGGALLVINGTNTAAQGGAIFTIGMLVAFQMFASRMSQPLLRLVGLWQEFQQTRISVKRLGDIMDSPPEPFTLIPQRSTSNAPGRIELAGLSFRYSEHHPWLYRELSIVFKPGRLTLLVGPSGCGKSTLAKLLQGFYPPTDGIIRIDGHDISHLSANELRGNLGVVPQETLLFAGSVHDNLQAANPHADFDAIVAACKQAEIHATIEALPQGYQTALGEQGVGLSGGQRQRIAIARALLKQPKILIFDEATSSLDAETAAHLARTVNALKGSATIVFIAHVVPEGLKVDDVVRFEGGGGRV